MHVEPARLYLTLLRKAFCSPSFAAPDSKNVVTDRIRTVLRSSSAEQALIASFTGGPVALAYSRFDEPTRQEAHAEYLESIAEYRRSNDQDDIPGEFVIVAGNKE